VLHRQGLGQLAHGAGRDAGGVETAFPLEGVARAQRALELVAQRRAVPLARRPGGEARVGEQVAALLVQAFDEVEADPDCRVAVLAAEGAVFCAGQASGKPSTSRCSMRRWR